MIFLSLSLSLSISLSRLQVIQMIGTRHLTLTLRHCITVTRRCLRELSIHRVFIHEQQLNVLSDSPQKHRATLHNFEILENNNNIQKFITLQGSFFHSSMQNQSETLYTILSMQAMHVLDVTSATRTDTLYLPSLTFHCEFTLANRARASRACVCAVASCL